MFFRSVSCYFCFFFFSSRRRHTRLTCDWSSDVCSSDLDSRSGPGVFYRLRDVRRGQRVYVTRGNRTVARFKVTAVREYAKDSFPAAAVYGPVPDAELRLITCGGSFDYATGSYLSNVVVYAVLVR